MLCSKIQVINEDDEQDRTQVFSLGYITNYLPPGRLCAPNQSTLSLAVQPVLNPPHCLLRILLLREALVETKVEMRQYAKVNSTNFI